MAAHACEFAFPWIDAFLNVPMFCIPGEFARDRSAKNAKVLLDVQHVEQSLTNVVSHPGIDVVMSPWIIAVEYCLSLYPLRLQVAEWHG
jgi:hypothetical protein